jgi:Kef-type K+ transport system membrane component KefB
MDGVNLNLYQYYSQYGEVASVLIGFAIILFTGFLVTRFTKLLKLPNVTAYIVAGILLRSLGSSGAVDPADYEPHVVPFGYRPCLSLPSELAVISRSER